MPVEQQPTDCENYNSLTDSPEDDSNEDYSPPYAEDADQPVTEDRDSKNESEPDCFHFVLIYMFTLHYNWIPNVVCITNKMYYVCIIRTGRG